MDKKNDFLKILAILFMVIDHIGIVFFPSSLIFRVIGRLSFPLFAYGIAEGYFYTSSWKNYSLRLLLFAFISQIPYSLLFDTWRLNIFFTLLLSLLLLHFLVKRNYPGALLLVCLAYITPVSYGVFGVILPALYFFMKKQRLLLMTSQLLVTFVYSISIDALYQMTSVLATLLVWYSDRSLPINLTCNKYIFYWFYPLHLILLYLASHI